MRAEGKNKKSLRVFIFVKISSRNASTRLDKIICINKFADNTSFFIDLQVTKISRSMYRNRKTVSEILKGIHQKRSGFDKTDVDSAILKNLGGINVKNQTTTYSLFGKIFCILAKSNAAKPLSVINCWYEITNSRYRL